MKPKPIPPPPKSWIKKAFAGVNLPRTVRKTWIFLNGNYIPAVQVKHPPVKPGVIGTAITATSYTTMSLALYRDGWLTGAW